MTPLDGSIVAVALAKMGPALHLSFSASIWVQASYLLSMAVLLIPLGRLADHHGRVHFYLAGIVIFTLGSLLAGLSASGAWLIVSRVIQGSGAALLSATSQPSSPQCSAPGARPRFRHQRDGRVCGAERRSSARGQIVDHLGCAGSSSSTCRSACCVPLGWLLLPRHERESSAAPRHDLLGSGCRQWPLPVCWCPDLRLEWLASARTVGLLAVSAVSFIGFVVTERRVRDPLLDMDLLLHNRLFAAANAAALLNYMALYAISILTAIFLEVVQHKSAGLTGWIMLAQPAVQAVLSRSRSSERPVGSRVLSTSGMVLTAAGMVLLAFLPATVSVVHVMGALALVASAWPPSARPTRAPSWAAWRDRSSAWRAPSWAPCA